VLSKMLLSLFESTFRNEPSKGQSSPSVLKETVRASTTRHQANSISSVSETDEDSDSNYEPASDEILEDPIDIHNTSRETMPKLRYLNFANKNVAKAGSSTIGKVLKFAHLESPATFSKPIIRPAAVSFLTGLFSFFAKIPYALDSDLTTVFKYAVDLVLAGKPLVFNGFSDNQKIEAAVMSQICIHLHQTLMN